MVNPAENTPAKQLRLLLVEDSPQDAELLVAELEAAGYEVTMERVETAEAMQAALLREPWQVVLSDYNLPAFSAPEALEIVKKTNPDLPFIIVSGTIGEETAVTALKAGADDFLTKGKLARLIPSIERELTAAALRTAQAREREVLEDQLRQAQRLESIGRLAGGIAHDFNNLLTAIIGYTEMVLEQIGPDKPISRDLDEIRAASDRAVVLTRQLLAFSRKQTLHVAPMDLNDIVTSIHDMLQRLIGEDVHIALRLAGALPPILADRGQVEQVLMNLVVNARDAMPHGGIVTIETASASAAEVTTVNHVPAGSANYVRLSVVDTGTGMDKATQSRIFEPFFTTKELGQGTGLGLSVVHGVMQQLGGHISVVSQLQHGTTFGLYFPTAGHDAERVQPSSTRSSAVPLASHREVVLVVEDQRGVRQLVSRILTRHGYAVLEASSGAEALVLFEQHRERIDLLVTDVVMPKIGGPELASALTARRPDLAVLFMSGYTGEDSFRRNDFPVNAPAIEKPFNASTLLRVVRDVLDRRTVA